jgi:hypothetical protein
MQAVKRSIALLLLAGSIAGCEGYEGTYYGGSGYYGYQPSYGYSYGYSRPYSYGYYYPPGYRYNCHDCGDD